MLDHFLDALNPGNWSFAARLDESLAVIGRAVIKKALEVIASDYYGRVDIAGSKHKLALLVHDGRSRASAVVHVVGIQHALVEDLIVMPGVGGTAEGACAAYGECFASEERKGQRCEELHCGSWWVGKH